MTTLRLFLTLLMLLLALTFISSGTKAQGCEGVMQPEYSSYTSYALDSNNTIYVTVVLDGTTQIGNTEYCNISNARHIGYVSNTLGSTGGSINSGYVSPTAYISLSNPQQIIGAPGVVYYDNNESEVECTLVGTLYSLPGSFNVKIADTNMISEGPPDENDLCNYMEYCPNGNTEATCPVPTVSYYYPDHPEYPGCAPYVVLYTLVVDGKCLDVGGATLTNVAHDCT